MDGIPPEVLERIFFYILSMESLENFVLLVSHVCSRWRTIALQRSDFWKTVEVDTNTTSLDLVRNQLLRSQSQSLDVRLTEVAEGLPPAHAHGRSGAILTHRTALLNLVLGELPRIRCLDLILYAESYLSFVHLLLAEALELKNLRLRSIGYSALMTEYEPLRMIFPKVPNLHTLAVEGFPSDVFSQFVFQVHMLVSLTMHISFDHWNITSWDSCEDLLSAIRSMKKLKNLALNGCVVPWTIPDDDLPEVICPKLETLSLSGYVPHVAWLLNHLILPECITVDVATLDRGELPPGTYSAFGSTLSRSLYHGPGWTSLCHAGCFYSPSEVHRDSQTQTAPMLHFVLSDTADVVSEHYNHARLSPPLYTWRGWSDLESSISIAREQAPKPQGQQRTLHIRILESAVLHDGRDKIWRGLHLPDVESLHLHNVPRIGGTQQLQPEFARYAGSMAAVNNVYLRGWDTYWKLELHSILPVYGVTTVAE